MKDLTKGSPIKLILLFALPVLAGNIFSQLYNLADTVIVGNTINSDAFTGVGLTGSITFLVFGFVNGLTSGFCVRISQKFGAHDSDGMRHAMAMSVFLCIIITVVVTAIAMPLAKPLLILMKTPEVNFDYAYGYLMTIFGGMCTMVYLNLLTGILRATGDSKSPLIFLVISVVSNIGLDFLFILGFKMYYTGAAAATVASHLISGTACLIYILKRYPELRLKRGDWRWDWRVAGEHLSIGLPMALQFSITAIGMMVQQTALNGLNSTLPGVATAYVASAKIDGITQQVFVALGSAMATFAGQNSGAGRYDRVRKGVRTGILLTVMGAVISVLFCMALYNPLMNLFLNTEKGGDAALYYKDIMVYGRNYLLCQSGTYLLLGLIYCYRSTLQGMGRSFLAMFAGVMELAGRVTASLVFVKFWGFTGICLSNPAAWLCADIFFIICYYTIIYRMKKAEKSSGTCAKPEAEAA